MSASSSRNPVQALGAALALALAVPLLLAGCASGPRAPSTPAGSPAPRPDPGRDGPEAVIPPNLHLVPDAEPRVEALRRGGPNKPYEVLGQRYEPLTSDQPLLERGLASWYGRKFHGRSTSSGETYNMYAMTAAHPTMPIPSYARVRNPANGREVLVRVNDRGPFHPGRIIDLSYTAALKLDTLRGVTPVEIERLTFEDIRTGAWRRDNPPPVFVASEAAGAPERSATFGAQAKVDPALLLPADEPSPPSAPKLASPGYWLQLGAFSRLDGAETLRQKLASELEGLAPLLAIFKDSALHRLQAGPYPTREEARQAAERLRVALNLQPVVVRR